MNSDSGDSIPDSSPAPIEATAISGEKSGAGAATPHPSESNQDADHLRLLSIFHYVIAAIIGLVSLLPLLHVAVGLAILTGQFEMVDESGNPPPAFFGWMFVIFPLVFIFCGLAMAIAIAVAGRKLRRQTGYLYCLIIAALECFFMPIGTVLGVFTIIVLMRPSVKDRFGVTSTYP